MAWRAMLVEVAERDAWFCSLCQHPVSPDADANADDRPTIDHVIPKSLGGPDTLDNYRLAHRACNLAKGNGIVTARPMNQADRRAVKKAKKEQRELGNQTLQSYGGWIRDRRRAILAAVQAGGTLTPLSLPPPRYQPAKPLRRRPRGASRPPRRK